jgi:hypothetical protein
MIAAMPWTSQTHQWSVRSRAMAFAACMVVPP